MKATLVRNALYGSIILAAWLLAGACRADRLLQSPGGGDDTPPPPPPPLAPFAPIGLAQLRSDSQTPIQPGQTIGEPNIVIAAIIDDPEDGDSLRLQLELRVSGAAFTGVPTHMSDRVGTGRRALIAVNGITADTSFSWRVRAVDRMGRASDWESYSSAGVDFRVYLPKIPAAPTELAQLREDRRTVIPVGGTVSDRDIWLQARVNDPGRENLRLDIEIRPVDQPLTGVATHHEDEVQHGELAEIKIRAGAFQTYHWQSRVCDQDLCSAWVGFGGNPESAGDFTRDPFLDDDLTGTTGPLD